MIKFASEEMLLAMLHVINASWADGCVPDLWKAADVRPLLKEGVDRHQPSSYRPISLLSVVGKLAERLIHHILRDEVEAKGVLPPYQSGFRPGHSVLDHLTRLSLDAHDSFGTREVLVGVLLDVEKAYDSVWRADLLKKLHALGIRGRLLPWLTSFLCCRRQRARLDGSTSGWVTLDDGVPQGAVLSCLLYTIFASDALEPRDPAA